MPTTAQNLLDTPYALSPEQIEAYRQRGYIKLKEVFDEGTLRAYGQAITERVKQFDREHGIPWEQRDTYQKAFIQAMNLWREDETVDEGDDWCEYDEKSGERSDVCERRFVIARNNV